MWKFSDSANIPDVPMFHHACCEAASACWPLAAQWCPEGWLGDSSVLTGCKPPSHRHPRKWWFYDDFLPKWMIYDDFISMGKMMTLTSRFPWISGQIGQKHLDHSEVGGPEHAQHQDDAAPEPAGKSREPQFQCEGRCKGWFLGGFNSKVPRCFQGVSDGFQWLLIALQRFS